MSGKHCCHGLYSHWAESSVQTPALIAPLSAFADEKNYESPSQRAASPRTEGQGCCWWGRPPPSPWCVQWLRYDCIAQRQSLYHPLFIRIKIGVRKFTWLGSGLAAACHSLGPFSKWGHLRLEINPWPTFLEQTVYLIIVCQHFQVSDLIQVGGWLAKSILQQSPSAASVLSNPPYRSRPACSNNKWSRMKQLISVCVNSHNLFYFHQ